MLLLSMKQILKERDTYLLDVVVSEFTANTIARQVCDGRLFLAIKHPGDTVVSTVGVFSPSTVFANAEALIMSSIEHGKKFPKTNNLFDVVWQIMRDKVGHDLVEVNFEFEEESV